MMKLCAISFCFCYILFPIRQINLNLVFRFYPMIHQILSSNIKVQCSIIEIISKINDLVNLVNDLIQTYYEAVE